MAEGRLITNAEIRTILHYIMVCRFGQSEQSLIRWEGAASDGVRPATSHIFPMGADGTKSIYIFANVNMWISLASKCELHVNVAFMLCMCKHLQHCSRHGLLAKDCLANGLAMPLPLALAGCLFFVLCTPSMTDVSSLT